MKKRHAIPVLIAAYLLGFMFFTRSELFKNVAMTLTSRPNSGDDAEDGDSVDTTTTLATENASANISSSLDFAPVNQASVDKTNWFDENGAIWERSCRKVEHVCFSSSNWWYDTTNSSKKNASQPPFSYRAHKSDGYSRIDYPRLISVRPATPEQQKLHCLYSAIPNHLILTSLYNEMLGEFYNRVLTGFAMFLKRSNDAEKILESTQVYLQLYNLDRKVLDSHHAFVGPFLRRQPLLDFRELLQSTVCICVQRLIMCGHEFENFRRNGEMLVRAGPGVNPKLDSWNWRENTSPFAEMYRYTRDELRKRAILENDMIKIQMREWRSRRLREAEVSDDFDEWKIVGLTQRSSRRQWINLQEIEHMCKKFWTQKIMCYVVNVEQPEYHPNRHIVVHGSLDALIGIHGAQMTEAIWMKPGSLVVEILPYLPPPLRYGSWTRTVDQPTPLGVIYHGTDLFHVGLPLTYLSVPQCSEFRGKNFTDCVAQIRWDSRDFSVEVQDVQDVLDRFVLNRPKSCQKLKEAAGEMQFVLYNVQCILTDDKSNNNSGQHFELQHFYWNKSLEDLDKFSSIPK